MTEQVTRTWAPANRCKDAFNTKSNPNRSAHVTPEQAGTPADSPAVYPKRCDPRPPRPPLTAEQRDLAERYLPLAYSIAKKRNARRLKAGATDELNELRSAAAAALVDAAGTFDPTRGVNFAVYSRWRIEGSLTDFERVVLWHNWRGNLAKRPKFRRLSYGVEKHGRVLYSQEQDPVGTQFEAIDEVEGALRPLTTVHAKACRLIYLEGKSQDEAAKVLGYSKSYFSRLHQAALSKINISA